MCLRSVVDVEPEEGMNGGNRVPTSTGSAGVLARSALRYWQTELDASAPVVQVPTDYSRTVELNFSNLRRSLALPTSLAAAIVAYAKQHQALVCLCVSPSCPSQRLTARFFLVAVERQK
jgi:hypothetical protein